MEHYRDYFKSRLEVEQFFKHQTFVFHFYSDSEIFFKTLNPIILDGNLINFQFSFYYNGKSFFNYSSFSDWLDEFQLASVVGFSEVDNESIEMYFEKYQ